jgi:hypothetical protein
MSEPVTLSCEPADLAGSWTFRRRVRDGLSGEHGHARGTAVFTTGPDGGSWREQGRLCWGGRWLPFSRTLGFAHVDGAWWVTFEDGRPFHPWRPGIAVTHPCRADTYRGLVVVDDVRAELRIGWDVTGPAKRQRIVTRYRR